MLSSFGRRSLVRSAAAAALRFDRSALVSGARFVHVEGTMASVQELIKNERVLVFSKTHCPHCARVKALFKELKIDFELVELDHLSAGPKIQGVLHELTKQNTVPNVFIKGQHIGGCDSTLALHAAHKLLPLLQ